MKGLKEIAEKSKQCKQTDASTHLPIYFDLKTETVNTDGKGCQVGMLIRENAPKEIEQMVNRWLSM